ncbi:MAG: type II toxin-antitoxin system HipA family toxin [Rubrivivax sp.]|nr:MAG: type II toxin-antitoxin system HipA family toxin [Rubrivivax sp.]
MTRRAPVYRWTLDPVKLKRVPVLVGELTQESSRWEFLFDSGYLARGRDAWELDPTVLRTKQRSAFTRTGPAPFPVFCDVALSGWSLEVVKRQAARTTLPGAEPWGWWERLLHAPADGFGALFVGEPDARPESLDAINAALRNITKESLAAAPLESSSGAMGGERPKVALSFELEDGSCRPSLLKFALPSERVDSVAAEATALTLAQELGMRVPEHEVMWFNDAPALRIARFDREGLEGAVWHCVSAATALDILPSTDTEDPKRNYVRLRSKLKRAEDAKELFARIILNAVVGNTDDHPWNTSLRQLGLGEWELSPLYDVLPFYSRAGVPAFRMDLTLKHPSRVSTVENLVAAGNQIAALERTEVIREIERSTDYVRENWRRIFESHSRKGGDGAEDWAKVFEYEWREP